MSTRPAPAPNEEVKATFVEDKPGYFQDFLHDVEEEIGLNFTSTRPAAVSREETRAESAVAPISTSFEDKPGFAQDLLRQVEQRLSGHREELHAQLSEDSWRHRSALDSHHDELYDKLVGCLLTSQAESQQHLSHLDGHCQDLEVRLKDATTHLEGIATLVGSHPRELAKLADIVAGKAGIEDLCHMESGLAEQRAALDAHRDELQMRAVEAAQQFEQLTTVSLGFVSARQFQELSEVVQGKVAADSLSELADAVAGKASAQCLGRLETGFSAQAAGLEDIRNELRAEISKAKVAADSLSELANAVADKANTEHICRLEAGLAKQMAGLENVRDDLRAEISKAFAQHQSALEAHREEVHMHTVDAARQRRELTESLEGFVSLGQFQELFEIVQGKADVAECRDLARAVESKATAESVSKLADVVVAKGGSEQLSELDAKLQELHRQVSVQDVLCEGLRTRVDEMSRQQEQPAKDLEARFAALDQNGQELDAQLLQCSAQLEALDASLETKASAGELGTLSDAAGKSSLEVRDLRTRLDHLHDQILQASGQQRSSMDVLREEQHARADEMARKHEQLSNIMRSMTREFDELVSTVGTKASRGDLSARLRAHAPSTQAPAPEIEIALPPEPAGRRRACCGLGADEDDGKSATSVSKQQQPPLCIEKSFKHVMASVDGGPKTFSIKPGAPRPCSVPRNLGSPRAPRR